MIRSSVLGKAYRDMSLPPDYTALWIILGAIAVIAAISLCIILYMRWQRKICVPVMLAGSTMYVLPGVVFATVNANNSLMGEDWLFRQISHIKAYGYRVAGLYIDSALTIPFDKTAKVTSPLRIYPKIIK